MPYVTPYRESTLSLDTATLPDGADIELSSQKITPTRGAIVRARFDTRVGKRVLMTLTRSNGEPVPFGAMVTTADNASSSIVGDNGQVYLTGMADTGTLMAKWGQAAAQQCHIDYQLSNPTPASGVAELQAICR